MSEAGLPGPAAKSPGPSPELEESAKAASEERRGRHKKDCACGKCKGRGGAGPGSPQAPPQAWTPESAAFLLSCIYAVPANVTGYDGFRLSDAERRECGPLTADVFNDVLPYDARWVKLAAFGAMQAALMGSKFVAYRRAVAAMEGKADAEADNAHPGADGNR